MQQPIFETFNSGILNICEVKDNKIIADVVKGIRYQNKTIGVTRYWNAQVASAKIDKLVSIPWIKGIEYSHIALINKEQYKINQIQVKEDTNPPTLLISLEKQVMIRKDIRNGNKN